MMQRYQGIARILPTNTPAVTGPITMSALLVPQLPSITPALPLVPVNRLTRHHVG